MRFRLLACVALTLALVACTGAESCAPCPGVGGIDIAPLRAGVTGFRLCFDGQCTALHPMPTSPDNLVGLGPEIYDASDVTLELYRGKQFLESYSGQIEVKRPKVKEGRCGPCDWVRLAPADDNTLVLVN